MIRPYLPCCVASLLLAAFWTEARAEWQPSREEIRAQRQAIIDGILSSDTAADVAIDRDNCMAGQMSSITRRARNAGGYSSPDAADTCVAALVRVGRDGRLIDSYLRIVNEAGGDSAIAGGLPDTIGSAIIAQKSESAPIGRGKGIRIDPALAFDAGFSAAYLKGETRAEGMPDIATLKAISEACLDRTEVRLGLCYAAGFAHAVRANLGEAIIAD